MRNRNHILFLVSGMQGGGAERVASILCNYWAENGSRVTLMPTFSGRGECVYHLHDGVELDFLADRVDSVSTSIWNRLYRFWVLRRFILQAKPDVIVSFLTHVNLAAILCAIGSEIPVIVSERTYPPKYPQSLASEILRRLLYPLAAAVVMQTEQGLAWLEGKISSKNGIVIHNPIAYPMVPSDPVVKPEDVITGSRKICLAVGRLSEEKRFSEIIYAFDDVARKFPGWDLIILGEGPERADLEGLVFSLNLNTRVHFPGRVGNLSDWYSFADVYVMNSRFEGFPNTLLEAMAHGMTVISADCDTGPRELITHGVDGLLVDPSTGRGDLSFSMEKTFSDPKFAKSLGLSAQKVRARFSVRSIGKKWDDLISLHIR